MLLTIRHFYPNEYGAEIQARRLARALIQKGVNITILTGRYGKLPRTETIDDIPIHRHFIGLYLPVIHELFYLTSLAWQLFIHRHEYDIIHLFQAQLSVFVAVIMGNILEKKVIIRSSNTGPEGVAQLQTQLPFGRWLFRLLDSRVDAFVAVSRAMLEEFAAVGFSQEKCHLISNGVELPDTTANDREENWIGLDLPELEEKMVALYVGRLTQHKGVETLVLAWRKVVREYPRAHLLLLGDGTLKEKLAEQVQEMGIAEKVSLLGKVTNVSDFLRVADMFILPSQYEGMPNAILEAMAYGLPVVTSRVSGAQDVIIDNHNGVLADLDSPEKIAKEMLALIASPGKRTTLGRAALQTIEENYSMSVVSGLYIQLYQSLLD